METIKTNKSVKPVKLKDHKYQVYSTLAFIIIIFIFGVPIWWKTTEIYRETIPNSSIMNLKNEDIQILTNIFIHTQDLSRSMNLANELSKQFDDNNLFLVNISPIADNGNYNSPATLESFITRKFKVKIGDFVFIEWQNLEDNILLTTERTAFFSNNTDVTDMYRLLMNGPLKTFRTNAFEKHENTFELKSRPLEHEHDILISLLNPKPEKMHVKWNARKNYQLYLEPFLKHINQLSNFSVQTQWKFHVPIEFPIQQILDDSPSQRHYKLSEEELPHIITSIEKYLGSASTEKFVTHLVVYILPCEISPLQIYTKNNVKVNQNNLNSFVSLKWGGLILYNPPADICLSSSSSSDNNGKIEFSINSKHILQTILYHLERIFEIHTDINLDGVKAIERESLEPRKWEYDATLRRNIIRNIHTATKTLQSLVQLLEDISYIVINYNVANSINKAFDNIILTKECLLQSDLDNALIYSKEAFKQSEEVFFEASLLAQLYFPDEQKYAIYIPLFLPIMVPVFSSLTMLGKLRHYL